MLSVEDIEVKLLSYGPLAEVEVGGRKISLDPDLLIAIEGIGTIRGSDVAERLMELGKHREDLLEFASNFHKESTRRGHSSLTTSLMLYFEINKCSRIASLLLVSPQFGSYLQESQRRRKLGRGEFFIPRRIKSEEKWYKVYEKAVMRAYDVYYQMIEHGIEVEDARYVLPLSSKTSLFACGSLETFLGLILDAKRFGQESQYYPEELSIIGKEIESIVRRVAPRLTEARLQFRVKLPTYPYANPYRGEDIVMENLIESHGERRLALLDLSILIDDVEIIQDSLEEPARAHVLNPLIQATFIESMSMAAYHQSIRHRTVPTAVESIYSAIGRCLSDQTKNLVVPPKIMSSESSLKNFYEAASTLLDAYRSLVDDGVRPSDAIYLAPQALKIYVIRSYNAFNLLWPQGYIAMRTCSYSQWEVRELAYEAWRMIEERAPRLGKMMGERCKLLGYCPERKWCPIILKYRRYDDELHRKVLGGRDT